MRRRGATGLAVAALGLVVVLTTPSAAYADAANPAWSGSCPQRIALVLDRSSSMEPQKEDIQRAAQDLVDALRGAPNLLGVVSFGTEATVDTEMIDVSDDDRRREVKDYLDDLDIFEESAGGTNWEAALESARTLDPDLVVLVTDGLPSVHGYPADLGSRPEDPQNVTGAAAAADRLQQDGARVVAVGLGLVPGAEANLAAVSGPAAGDDYYTAGIDGLLPTLYDVASKSCGVPVAALPQPEPRAVPVLPLVISGALTAAVLIAGVLLARRRGGSRQGPSVLAPHRGLLADPTIGLDDIPPVSAPPSAVRADERDSDVLSPGTLERSRDDVPEQPRRTARRIALGPPPPRGSRGDDKRG